jgi:hypothetical protein
MRRISGRLLYKIAENRLPYLEYWLSFMAVDALEQKQLPKFTECWSHLFEKDTNGVSGVPAAAAGYRQDTRSSRHIKKAMRITF